MSMDQFRVIRDFNDFTNVAAQYGYNIGGSQSDPTAAARGGASATAQAAWQQQAAYKNPYEDFGSMPAQQMAPSLFGPIGGEVERGSGGRKGRSSGGTGRYQQSQYQQFQQAQRQQQPKDRRRPPIRRQHTQYPYSPVPDSVEHKTIAVTANSAFCFHGYQSIFTLQHRFDFIIDGDAYKSVDQYYQLRKVKDLTGIISAKFTDGSTRDYSSLARDLLKQASVKRSDVENWRVTKGLLVIQKALLEKVRQCMDLRSAITSTGNKIIVQTFAGDDFYGSGTPVKYVKDWCSGLEEKKSSLKFPMAFPLTEDTVKYVPVIGKGKNVLGAIYMILREKIANGQLDNLRVDIATGGGGAAGGSGEPMNVDFAVDSNS